MDISLKRIIAYIIDILIVSLLVMALSNVSFLNPYKDEYKGTYDEYLELSEDMQDENYDIEAHEDEILSINYDIYKYKVYNNGISIIMLLLYFGVAQCICNGQTIGKKIMNIRIVSNKDKKLNFGNYLIRIVVLNNILFTLISIIAVYVCNAKSFYYLIYYLGLIQNAIYMINILMVVLKKDNRGLHDILAGTKVINLKETSVTKEEDVKENTLEKKVTIKEKAEKRKNKR